MPYFVHWAFLWFLSYILLTSLQVLFDCVPDIKFQDAIKLISMQPISSDTAVRKRCVSNEVEYNCILKIASNISWKLFECLKYCKC